MPQEQPNYDQASGVYKPMDTAVSSKVDAEVTILAVDQENTTYGPATVFTFQILNTGNQLLDPFLWSSPDVTYGPAGQPAEWFVDSGAGLGMGLNGPIPPGARQTVREPFKVAKADLTEAVVSEGSLVWQGDFSTFAR